MAPVSSKKWVSTYREKLVVSSAGDSVLGKIPTAAPVNLVSIVGPARNGKSSLMNAVIGDGDTFKMSTTVKPCTEGGDLSPYTVRLSEFEFKDVGVLTSSYHDPSDDPYIAFADVEGQGDESVDHDVRLATPFLLLSKVSTLNDYVCIHPGPFWFLHLLCGFIFYRTECLSSCDIFSLVSPIVAHSETCIDILRSTLHAQKPCVLVF